MFRVRVTEGREATDHRVTVPPGYLEELGIPEADPETVVRESFAFLLEREPAASILPDFTLPEIARYFPEYPAELPRHLAP
ncbi:MAG: hypothetical protein ACRDHJ_05135 [Actinomycetota bacterium]